MKRGLLIFAAGIAVFVVCVKFTFIGVWLSFLAGAAAIVLLRSIVKFFDRMRKGNTELEPAKKTAEQAYREGMDKLRLIANSTRLIKNNDVAVKIKEICKIGMDILDDIKKKPDDLKRAKQFLNYYLDASKKIIEQYAELSNRKDLNSEARETISKIEDMLETIKQTFQKQRTNLLENDLIDLNAEISVLKNTMKLEG